MHSTPPGCVPSRSAPLTRTVYPPRPTTPTKATSLPACLAIASNASPSPAPKPTPATPSEPPEPSKPPSASSRCKTTGSRPSRGDEALISFRLRMSLLTSAATGAGRHEFMNGGEHHAAARPVQQSAQKARIAASFPISSALNARSKTATPPIQPVKPTLRLLWMTRPMVKGPPLCASCGE